MNTLLLIYMAIYAIVWIGIYLAGSLLAAGEDDPLWETVLEIVLLTAGFVGMVLFLRGIEHAALKLAWRGVGPVLVMAQVWLFARYMRDRPRLLAEDDAPTEREMVWLELVAMLLLVPSLGVNLAYGFS